MDAAASAHQPILSLMSTMLHSVKLCHLNCTVLVLPFRYTSRRIHPRWNHRSSEQQYPVRSSPCYLLLLLPDCSAWKWSTYQQALRNLTHLSLLCLPYSSWWNGKHSIPYWRSFCLPLLFHSRNAYHYQVHYLSLMSYEVHLHHTDQLLPEDQYHCPETWTSYVPESHEPDRGTELSWMVSHPSAHNLRRSYE